MEILHTTEAKALVELQRKDTVIAALEARAAAVPVKLAALAKAFEEQRRSMSAAREALTALQLRKKDAELKLAEAEEGIRKHQRELNMIKNNDAFKALLSEIEGHKKAKDDLETEELVLFEEIDRAAVADKAAQAEIKKAEEAKNAAAAALEAEGRETAAALEKARGERAAAAASVNADLLAKYEGIRASRAGLAVVSAKEDAAGKFSCGGCNMGMTMQKTVDLKKADTFAVCADCRRLMYLEKTIFG
ncbi:MAG: hypothetical protein HY952_00125 [Elusimicrobia bacterium]|nr:hypothetical protein [Elusimicrobiota bacterium]